MTEPAPLGVYVHWPYCGRVCPYCDFNVVRDRGRMEEQAALADAIVADLVAQAARIGPRRLVSVFFGGGTPSLMSGEQVAQVIEAARALWDAAGAVEVTLEANPTDAESSRFKAFARAGVDRLSLGLQSLDDAALRFLGRNHTAAEGLRAAELAARAFPRLSLDLIYALPGQSARGWAAELERAVALGAEHISAYQLTVEPGTAFDRAVRRGALVPLAEAPSAELFEITQAVLGQAGFNAYEVSNHARGRAARSRHNLVYWRGQDYLGVGPGAHGRLRLDGARTATKAAPAIAAYIDRVRKSGVGWDQIEPLTDRETAEERLLMGFRTSEGVPLAELRPLGLHASAPVVRDLCASDHLVVEAGRLVASERGRLVLNRIVRELALAPEAV